MKDILWLVKNGLMVTFRKKSNIILYIFAPMIGIIISLVIFGGNGQSGLRVGIVNNDNNYIAKDLIEYMQKLGSFKFSNIDEAEINDKVASGKLDCVLIIRDGFSKGVLNGKPEKIEITSIKGEQGTAYVKSYLYNYINNIVEISKVSKGNDEIFKNLYNNYINNKFNLIVSSVKDKSKNKDMTSQSIGYLIMIVLMSAGNLSEIILKEKQNKTYFRISTAPISAKKYIAANVILNFIIISIEMIITLLALTKVFKIDMGIPFMEVLALLLLFGFVAIGFSLLTVAFAKSFGGVGALQNLIVTPTCLLSGCFIPIEAMPKYLQRISDFMPQKWVLSGLTSLQTGKKFTSIYMNILIIIAFAVVFFLIAIYRFYSDEDIRNVV
ncbi:transport permease protein [Clostridium zeae]|uniref:Transport permease protein n=1 Tax=Clostridium zeae TaxID=2759022 RepID=A0ABQ1EDU7_9CLOT|nr:ABC transporter permease [Clostridium zeae]GFZ32995.1 transport permease protein [Clostridium zeae]